MSPSNMQSRRSIDKEDPNAKPSGQLMTAYITVPQDQKEMTEGYDNSLF